MFPFYPIGIMMLPPSGSGAMIQIVILIGVAVTIGACAADPKTIQPSMVSTVGYDALTCDQLSKKTFEVELELLDLVSKQQNTRAVNAGMAIAFGVIGAAVSQNPKQEAEIGRLKGESIALRDAAARKACPIPPNTVLEAALSAAPPKERGSKDR